MSVAAVLALLLCWSLSLADDAAAALGDDVAWTDVNGDVATLLEKMNTLERRVVARLRRQESLNQDLTTKLHRQDSLNQDLMTRLLRQESLNQDLMTRLLRQESLHQEGHNVTKRPDSGRSITMPSDAAHNIAKRSDDDEPLLAVVNQISQRVTEQGAELQALKAQITADVQTLQNSDRQQETALQDARTSTFVRWGSSTCSNSSSLVYSGVVGGSWFGDTGAATNFLCLTQSPIFSQHSPPDWIALLYGAEYQTRDSHRDKDPLCAVCRSAFSTTLMVPGTDTCSSGWHLNYSGFLMAEDHAHQAGSEYICVDSAMENGPHGDGNEDGKLLAYTVTRCGSLPCGPYVNNKVVTCAVCSK